VCFFSGTIFNFLSYGFAPQSLLASLESVQFVTNMIFGHYLLGERITRSMYVTAPLEASPETASSAAGVSRAGEPGVQRSLAHAAAATTATTTD
jgi:hypothetical protein